MCDFIENKATRVNFVTLEPHYLNCTHSTTEFAEVERKLQALRCQQYLKPSRMHELQVKGSLFP